MPRDLPRYVVTKAPPTVVEHMKFSEKTGRFEKEEITIKNGFMVKFPASRNKHSIFFETKELLDDFIRRDADVSGVEDDSVMVQSEVVDVPQSVKSAAG
jgi:hypothetical protein